MGGNPPPAQSNATKAARQASLIFDDPRVHQFFDPNQRVGKAVARGLLSANIAWDIYLFYDKGIEWSHEPPKPARWMHRLPPDQADRGEQPSCHSLADALVRIKVLMDPRIVEDQRCLLRGLCRVALQRRMD